MRLGLALKAIGELLKDGCDQTLCEAGRLLQFILTLLQYY
jgi:hypothetical protein